MRREGEGRTRTHTHTDIKESYDPRTGDERQVRCHRVHQPHAGRKQTQREQRKIGLADGKKLTSTYFKVISQGPTD
jgi:hypothetical protein